MTLSTPSDALRRFIAQAIAAHEAVAARLGLNATDLRSLDLIGSEPEMTPSRLAELTGLTTGAVTGILDRLERSGFVRREADPADRRRTLVRLDQERMAEMTALYQPLIERAVEASRDWGPELRDNLGHYLDALADTLASEAMRLRVATHGGMLEDAYLAPLGEVARARLVLATGAPRVNLGRSALGQQVRMVAETAATRLTLRAAKPGGELIRAAFKGPPPDVRTADGTVTMRYRRRLIDTRGREIEAALHPGPAWWCGDRGWHHRSRCRPARAGISRPRGPGRRKPFPAAAASSERHRAHRARRRVERGADRPSRGRARRAHGPWRRLQAAIRRPET